MPEPETWEARSWNGVFPSPRQLLALAAWMATPVRSPKFGQRYNAWRIAVNREPLTVTEIEDMRALLPGRWHW